MYPLCAFLGSETPCSEGYAGRFRWRLTLGDGLLQPLHYFDLQLHPIQYYFPSTSAERLPLCAMAGLPELHYGISPHEILTPLRSRMEDSDTVEMYIAAWQNGSIRGLEGPAHFQIRLWPEDKSVIDR